MVKTGTEAPIVFLHIPKTAGQTIHSELSRAVGRKAVSPVRVHTQGGPGAAQFPPGYRLYSGHIDWEALETLPSSRFVFTVLRDPLERIASFYFFLRRKAERLSAQDLARPARTGMRMVLENSPDDYFFGGTPQWRRFIDDHHHSPYCSYLVTRRLRGHSQVADWPRQDLVARAVEAARGLDGVYAVDRLDVLERDLQERLGLQLNVTGRFVNADPASRDVSQWARLEPMLERDESRMRLRRFALADQMLMFQLGLGPRPQPAG
ncbi:sulfotransferase family protein [Roseovarius sp. A-2]|uniref:sulfotransferase family 2 domain-containing protein n=1 Tax=Roseovarius sp. A-2 TaxID=1570360 RepID=UPI0009B542A6|nr:sulfotransferase family 2 domain-containing protein [Roseovarius sp. A-2]GAW37304.1 sulfotransferase family protein [Roseovarius sp. A-2]